jgi:hypothetical protein
MFGRAVRVAAEAVTLAGFIRGSDVDDEPGAGAGPNTLETGAWGTSTNPPS